MCSEEAKEIVKSLSSNRNKAIQIRYHEFRVDEVNKFIKRQYHILYLMIIFFIGILTLKYEFGVFDTQAEFIIGFLSIFFVGVYGLYDLIFSISMADKNSEIRKAVELKYFYQNNNQIRLNTAQRIRDFFRFPFKDEKIVTHRFFFWLGFIFFVVTLLLFCLTYSASEINSINSISMIQNMVIQIL